MASQNTVNWILTKDDLAPVNTQNYSFDKVSLYGFKNSAITLRQIERAEYILYIDGRNKKVLKDKYPR